MKQEEVLKWFKAVKKCMKQKSYGNRETCELCIVSAKKATEDFSTCYYCICYKYLTECLNEDELNIVISPYSSVHCLEIIELNATHLLRDDFTVKNTRTYLLKPLLKFLEAQILEITHESLHKFIFKKETYELCHEFIDGKGTGNIVLICPDGDDELTPTEEVLITELAKAALGEKRFSCITHRLIQVRQAIPMD